jgi:transcriptional regulator with XRE-family HTH domain
MDDNKLSILIGKRIRDVRLKKGLRQEDMEIHSFNYKYFQKVEYGKVNVTLKTLEKIANALEIDPIELFQLPFASSPENSKLAASISEIILQDDEVTAKMLNTIIGEILSWKKACGGS